ncbi:MAG: alpha-amylase family glycosyl hydrolase [Bacteroidota bacterium]
MTRLFFITTLHSVPADFFEQWTDALYDLEPIFMLAEAEVPELRNSGSFIMDYAWEMHHLLNQIAKTQGASRSQTQALQQGNLVETDDAEIEPHDATDIDALLAKKAGVYKQGYQMQFTSNHDENSWAGTEFERMGDGHQAFALLTATFNGMPLIYTGMEAAMDKRLEFFTKDEVPWGDYQYTDFYRTLFNLKHQNEALWNGEYGGELVKVPTGNDEYIYTFAREKNGDQVFVMINLSSESQVYSLEGDAHLGSYASAFGGEEMTISERFSG